MCKSTLYHLSNRVNGHFKVFGPSVQQVALASDILSKLEVLAGGVIVNKLEHNPTELANNYTFIDACEVGEVHTLTLEREEAGGHGLLPISRCIEMPLRNFVG